MWWLQTTAGAGAGLLKLWRTRWQEPTSSAWLLVGNATQHLPLEPIVVGSVLLVPTVALPVGAVPASGTLAVPATIPLSFPLNVPVYAPRMAIELIRQKLKNRQCRNRFTRARFANERQGLAGCDIERHPFYGFDLAEFDA